MKSKIALVVLLMLAAASTESGMGRKMWGTSGTPGFWSGDIWSSHNSQYLLDPYVFTHTSHGVLFYGILSVIAGKLSVGARLVLAVALESGWEVLENTDMVIERYRAETISLNYFGDSIVNSMADIAACILGFVAASRLPRRATALGFVAVEIILVLWIRDNLALNILMLILPSRAIQAWQSGK
jgi:hypothetical protein